MAILCLILPPFRAFHSACASRRPRPLARTLSVRRDEQTASPGFDERAQRARLKSRCASILIHYQLPSLFLCQRSRAAALGFPKAGDKRAGRGFRPAPQETVNRSLEIRGFEPLTYGLQSRRSSQLSYIPQLCIIKKWDEEEETNGRAPLAGSQRSLAGPALPVPNLA